MKRQITIVAIAMALAAPSVFAASNAQLKAIKKIINTVPVPELAAKAAELVTQAAKEDREAVAVTVVRAAISKSRSSAPLVVAAISKAAPEVAAPVSRVAAEMETAQSGSIAAAAIGAAPSAKAEITSSVRQGVYGASSSSTIASFISDTSSDSTTRGSARGVNNGHSENKGRPINERGGGNGHGRFPTSPPHGGNPPGHNGQPDRHGPPPFVDYSQPRHF
ncbi:MAG TPA: hypothetical protein VM680_02905 [Verrucomicrobiae bacterium]|nr:hypothetical protein [Verrucomicrobiae bacterium]